MFKKVQSHWFSCICYMASTGASLMKSAFIFCHKLRSGGTQIPFIVFQRIAECTILISLSFGWHQSMTYDFGNRHPEPSGILFGTHLELFGTMWICLVPSGAIWSNLGLSGPMWRSTRPFLLCQVVPRLAKQGSKYHLTQYMMQWRSTYSVFRWSTDSWLAFRGTTWHDKLW